MKLEIEYINKMHDNLAQDLKINQSNDNNRVTEVKNLLFKKHKTEGGN